MEMDGACEMSDLKGMFAADFRVEEQLRNLVQQMGEFASSDTPSPVYYTPNTAQEESLNLLELPTSSLVFDARTWGEPEASRHSTEHQLQHQDAEQRTDSSTKKRSTANTARTPTFFTALEEGPEPEVSFERSMHAQVLPPKPPELRAGSAASIDDDADDLSAIYQACYKQIAETTRVSKLPAPPALVSEPAPQVRVMEIKHRLLEEKQQCLQVRDDYYLEQLRQAKVCSSIAGRNVLSVLSSTMQVS
jgi:hypothetical protein